LDLNGKDPLVDTTSEWLRVPAAEPRHGTGRHRVRRRARKVNNIRAKIRLRMWLACTGALLMMVIGIYLALGRERPSESGLGLEAGSGTVAAVGLLGVPAA
jgi:hypothetical protein